jgi:peptidyl-prolyl cis-trans isomerase D
MITVMRKHHKVLMIVITALVCISFSWYWNKTDFAQMGQGTVGRIYDRNVSQLEFQRGARLLRLGSQLGMHDLIEDLTGEAQTEAEAYENFSWNLMVLRHETEELGIKPTTAEIANVVKALLAFQGTNGFDLAKYTDFADHALAPMGFSEAQIEELAGNQIALERVKRLLSAGISVPESEMRNSYEQAYAKMEVSVVRFPSADFAKEVQVSDPDIAKYFEAHKVQLKTDEKRKVKFVTFSLTDEQKKLTGKQRIDVLQKLADKANDFTDALQGKSADFDQVAAKFQLAPKETGEFTQAAPDPQLAVTPQLAQTAFALTNDSPNSDAIQAADGFYVEHLTKIEPARPLTLEEARPKIVAALTQERLQGLVAAKAAEAAQKLRDALKSGKSTDEAALQAGVKVEKVPAFALLDHASDVASAAKPEPKNEGPDMPYIKQTASEMKPGEVSDFVRMPDGGLLVVLEKREPIDAAQYESAHPFVEGRALRNKSQIVFYEWLRERRRAAGVEETKPQRAPG